MGSPTTSRDAFLGSAPARGLHTAQLDHFKLQFERWRGKQGGGLSRTDAFARKKKGASYLGFYNPFASGSATSAALEPQGAPGDRPKAETPPKPKARTKADAPRPQPTFEPKAELPKAPVPPRAPPAVEPPKAEATPRSIPLQGVIEPAEAELPRAMKSVVQTGPSLVTRLPFLRVVGAAPKPVIIKEVKPVEVKRETKAGKTSSLVLVSAAPLATAMAEEAKVVTGGGGGDGETPALDRSKPDSKRQPKPKTILAGGGGAAGALRWLRKADAGGPSPARVIPDHKDRLLNQDDLMGVAIVVTFLVLLALYFFRGQGAPAPAVSPIVSTQFAAVSLAPAVTVPPPDPFGDQPVDLTPKSPPPPIEVAATPPPPALLKKPADLEMHAFFCTAKSDLTQVGRQALEKQLTEYASYFSGKELVVAGYTDTRGTAEYNSLLGGARASTIAAFLKAKGVKIAETTGVGELIGLEDNEDCSNQRRVDISVAGEAATAPSRACAPPKEAEVLACG